MYEFAPSDFPGQQHRQIHLTGANLKDGRSVVYALVCKVHAYYGLLLQRITDGDATCAKVQPEAQEWKDIVAAAKGPRDGDFETLEDPVRNCNIDLM